MTEQRSKRRLAAILAADVVGYSRLIRADEAGTVEILKARRRNVLEPVLARHGGRIVKLMGDGVLVEFASAVDAVECAVQLQEDLAIANADQPAERHIVLRIGINLGDVIVEGSDLYGDGVNIAARLESIAEPGSILISGTAHEHVVNKAKLGFEDCGLQTLKNIAEPIRTYRVTGTPAVAVTAPKPISHKPSIAVLPFTNLSGDPEQEYFSDGITEDIITDLSKVSALRVLSRNTVFAYKNKPIEISKWARQVNIDHVVEGSVRRSDGRIRISAQLVDAHHDSHLWAERYDRDVKDIFTLQDEVSGAIVAALKVKLLPEEAKAIEKRPTHNLEAYEQFLLGRNYQLRFSVRSLEIAIRFFRRAVDIDPSYARAWAMIALSEVILFRRGKRREPGLESAERALVLDSGLAEAHAVKGYALTQLGRSTEALIELDEALRLDPDSYDVRYIYGETCHLLGKYEAAIEHFEQAAQLLPSDYSAPAIVSMSFEALGRTEGAMSAMKRALELIEQEISVRPDNGHALMMGASALASLGQKERAMQWASRAQAIEPDEPVGLYNLACTLTKLGELDQALDVLETCVPNQGPELINWIKRDPDFGSLRAHPRFLTLIARGETRLAAAQENTPSTTP